MVCWSSVHGDLVGAYRTGIQGAITQLRLTSKDILVAGTWCSLIVMWQIFEPARTLIPKRDPARVNVFETIMTQQSVAQGVPAAEVKKEPEEAKLLPHTPAKTEPVESLDKP